MHVYKVRPLLLEAQRYKCANPFCRRKLRNDAATEVDHIVPVAKGGGGELSNLQALCTPCNRAKRDKRAMGTGWKRSGCKGRRIGVASSHLNLVGGSTWLHPPDSRTLLAIDSIALRHLGRFRRHHVPRGLESIARSRGDLLAQWSLIGGPTPPRQLFNFVWQNAYGNGCRGQPLRSARVF